MKLAKFTQFAGQLFPHELIYLQQVAQFQDTEKAQILSDITQNVSPKTQFVPYDESIDRRKYSYIINWITQRLNTINVDRQYEWIVDLEQKVMTDTLNETEEKDLLRSIKEYQKPLFYFSRFYELVMHYRSYLLIRMRYPEHSLTESFLTRFRFAYDQSVYTNERLHQATLDITKQYSDASASKHESKQWESFLLKTFYDNNLDGHKRNLAGHRLAFLYTNYGEFEKLKEVYDYLDGMLASGLYYSRRILSKYYANRLILHAKLQEWEMAEEFGYLSIRYEGSEYLQHLTNLSAVLLRQEKTEEAQKLLQKALPALKKTQSYHDKTGFAAFYIKSLFETENHIKAKKYGASFLRQASEDIFLQRWHIFFTCYFEVLVHLEDFETIRTLAKKYKLKEREVEYEKRPNYLPHLSCYIGLAEYKEGKSSERAFMHLLQDKKVKTLIKSPRTAKKVRTLKQELEKQVPMILKLVSED